MASIEILPSDTGEMNISIKLGRLEAGLTHEISVDVINGWKFPYELQDVVSNSEMIKVVMSPQTIRAGESGQILLSIVIPANIDRVFDGSMRVKGRFVIGGN